MDMRRAIPVVLLVLIVVFGISFVLSLQKYKSTGYWLVRPTGQFHSIQALRTSKPVVSVPIGSSQGRYAVDWKGDVLVFVEESPVAGQQGVSRRSYSFLRQNGLGGFDQVGAAETIAAPDEHPPLDDVTEGRNLEDAGVLMREFLLPVPDMYVIEAVRSRVSGGKFADRLMAAEFEKHPDEIVLYLTELATAVKAGDGPGAEKWMGELESRFAEQRPEFVAEVLQGAREGIASLQGGDAGEDGEP